MKEKFIYVPTNIRGHCAWVADLEATHDANGKGRVLIRVCSYDDGSTRLIAAVSNNAMGKPGAPEGDPRIIADMTREEAFSLGMMLVRAATGKGLPDVVG